MSLLATVYLLAVNVVTFLCFAIDKRAAAHNRRRVPERHLLTLALIGGTAGAIAAQQILRHKTRKEPFRSTLWTLAALHLGLLATLAYRLR